MCKVLIFRLETKKTYSHKIPRSNDVTLVSGTKLLVNTMPSQI